MDQRLNQLNYTSYKSERLMKQQILNKIALIINLKNSWING